MTKRKFTNSLAGVGNVLAIAHPSKYIYPQKGDFAKDRRQMGKDAMTFNKNLYSVTKKEYEKVLFGKD